MLKQICPKFFTSFCFSLHKFFMIFTILFLANPSFLTYIPKTKMKFFFIFFNAFQAEYLLEGALFLRFRNFQNIFCFVLVSLHFIFITCLPPPTQLTFGSVKRHGEKTLSKTLALFFIVPKTSVVLRLGCPRVLGRFFCCCFYTLSCSTWRVD